MLRFMKGLGLMSVCFISLMLVSSIYCSFRYPPSSMATPFTTATTLSFDPEETQVQVGENFTIHIKLTDLNEELWGFEVGVRFDNTILEYVGVELPSWRFVSGQKEWIFWVAGITPQTEDQTLLTLTFCGIGVGESTLDFYSHKLATVKYWDAPHDYIGWPITHKVSTAVVDVS